MITHKDLVRMSAEWLSDPDPMVYIEGLENLDLSQLSQEALDAHLAGIDVVLARIQASGRDIGPWGEIAMAAVEEELSRLAREVNGGYIAQEGNTVNSRQLN